MISLTELKVLPAQPDTIEEEDEDDSEERINQDGGEGVQVGFAKATKSRSMS